MPYRVLIAEDESEIARALGKMVNDHPLFDVAKIVGDGQVAIEALQKAPAIDLLLTDIQMPGYDGLELLAYVREHHSGMKCVIISAYSSFEYARTALQCGAFDYLLKPIHVEKCHAMLNLVAKAFEHDTQHRTWDLTSALSIHSIPLPPHQNPLFLIAVAFGHYLLSPVTQAKAVGELPDYIAFLPRSDCETMGTGIKNGVEFLLFSAPTHGVAAEFYQQLLQTIGKDPQRWKTLSSVLSQPLPEDGDLSFLEIRLEDHLRRNAMFLSTVSLDMNVSAQSNHQALPNYRLLSMDEPLASSIRSCQQGSFKVLFQQKILSWKNAGLTCRLLIENLKYQYIAITQMLFPSPKGEEQQNAPIPYDWEQQLQAIVSKATSWEALAEQCEGMFSSIFTFTRSKDAAKEMISEIEAYICSHYAQHISNQTLAKKFGFVPSYISKLFKDSKGLSPCDFLSKVRVENAQRMIIQMDALNISEIAQAVGFSDPGYFTKVFKKLTGMTPSDYKMKIDGVEKPIL